MESVYNIAKSYPELVTWAFGVVNAFWLVFTYFNNKAHDNKLEKLKSSFKIREAEVLPILAKIQELEGVAGMAKEVATSYRPTEEKKRLRAQIYERLGDLAGQFSKYPSLMQSVRDLNQYCAIMAEDDPHDSCREDVMKAYGTLIAEAENVRQCIKA